MQILQWQHTAMMQVNFCPSILLFSKLNKTQVLGGVFHSEPDLYMNWKSSCIGTDLSISWLTEHVLKHRASRKVILLSDGHRTCCSSRYCFTLLLKITLPSCLYRVTIPFSFWVRAFFGPLKSYINNEAAACKITWYLMAPLIGFAWRKVFRGCRCRFFPTNGYLSFQTQQSAWVFVLRFRSQLNYGCNRNNISTYGSGFCTLFFSNQISKGVTCISRTFIKYYEHYNFFWHFPRRNYFIQTFEEIQCSSENTEKISNCKNSNSHFITEEAGEKVKEAKRK